MSAETPAAVSSDRHKARRGTEASALSRPPALPGNPPKRTSRPSQLHCSLPQSKQPPLVAITITLKGFGVFFSFFPRGLGLGEGEGEGEGECTTVAAHLHLNLFTAAPLIGLMRLVLLFSGLKGTLFNSFTALVEGARTRKSRADNFMQL